MPAAKNEATMSVDKRTKGAVRFAPGDDSPIGSIYIRKPLGDELGEKIKVVITKA